MFRFLKLRRIRRCFFVLVIIVMLYWVIKTVQLKTPITFVFINDTLGETDEYIINTSGCKIPKLDPFHSSIAHFIKRLPELDCNSSEGQPLVYLHDDVIRLNPIFNNRSQVNCTMKVISRKTDYENEVSEQHIISNKDMAITSEFTHVECTMTDDYDISENYNFFYPVIKRKPKVERRIKNYFRQNKKRKNGKNTKLRVILLGLDSVSKNQFLRHMLKTHAFMKKKLTYIELNGYNKIGPNTYANVVPLFTGKLVSEVPDTTEVPVDVLPLIWKRFMDNGYRTQFSEDYPEGSIFNYARKGFNETPVDYYLRPFSLALEPHINSWNTGCLNNETEASVIFKWMQDFLDFFPRDPLFTFTFLTRMSHDYFNFLSYHDKPIHDFFERLYLRGHFNNSVMFFFGDHGFRFGEFRSTYIGRMEGRLPFMFIIVPPWFPRTYPQLYESLKANEDRLTTPLDIYATLKDILYFTGEASLQEGEGRSISLLRHQVPARRTCQDAHIKSQWCSCFQRVSVHVNDSKVVLCAKNIVRRINHITSRNREQCAAFLLSKVLNASTHIVDLGENVTNDGLTNFLVTLEVTPSNGVFEGSIWYDGKSLYTVEDTIERINMYGNQSACVDVNDLKPYCYCRSFQHPENA